ncbi:RNA polymerase sigma factor [Brevundimonas sp.]|uniref:RNA polymerase sigma factor n=1 Tax=Brevundimonas sp. TaxID=1871086 RepID=UPI003567DC07
MSEAESIGDVASARRQSRARLDRLYRRYSSWLEARLRRRYGADAEDIVQDAWLKIAPLEATLDIRHPKAFLLTLATNLARSRGRQADRRYELLELNMTPGAAGHAGGQAEALELEELILGLPQPLRDVFVLSRFVGLTNLQISEQLGISPKTVEGRMTKALAHCAAQLRR